MNTLLVVLAGVVLALLLASTANRGIAARAQRIYAVALIVAALVYVAFGLLGNADAHWLLLEGAGVALFGATALLGLRRWPAVLAAGWTAHVVWDLALHLDGAGAAYTPSWYPWLCVGFDLALAATILTRPGPARAT